MAGYLNLIYIGYIDKNKKAYIGDVKSKRFCLNKGCMVNFGVMKTDLNLILKELYADDFINFFSGKVK